MLAMAFGSIALQMNWLQLPTGYAVVCFDEVSVSDGKSRTKTHVKKLALAMGYRAKDSPSLESIGVNIDVRICLHTLSEIDFSTENNEALESQLHKFILQMFNVQYWLVRWYRHVEQNLPSRDLFGELDPLAKTKRKSMPVKSKQDSSHNQNQKKDAEKSKQTENSSCSDVKQEDRGQEIRKVAAYLERHVAIDLCLKVGSSGCVFFLLLFLG